MKIKGFQKLDCRIEKAEITKIRKFAKGSTILPVIPENGTAQQAIYPESRDVSGNRQ